MPGRPCHIVREGHAYYPARVQGNLAFRLWKSCRCFKVLERVNERIPVAQKIVLLKKEDCFADGVLRSCAAPFRPEQNVETFVRVDRRSENHPR